jgi:hypothetical protein
MVAWEPTLRPDSAQQTSSLLTSLTLHSAAKDKNTFNNTLYILLYCIIYTYVNYIKWHGIYIILYTVPVVPLYNVVVIALYREENVSCETPRVMPHFTS